MSGGTFVDDAHFSSGNDERGTPLDLIRPLKRAIGGFDLDAASGCEPEPIAPERYTEEDDGLAKPWFGDVWLNPPYSDIAEWMQKAHRESQNERVDSVTCLVPNRTSTRWFHDYAAHADAYVVIDGRLKYVHTDGSAPFPSAIIVFGDVPQAVYGELAKRGVVYRRDGEPESKQTTLAGTNQEPEGE
jgi:phage N-6-adenine-methyltransferase